MFNFDHSLNGNCLAVKIWKIFGIDGNYIYMYFEQWDNVNSMI